MRVITGLTLGSIFARNRRSLLEESVHPYGCRRARLVKECDYVVRFILFCRRSSSFYNPRGRDTLQCSLELVQISVDLFKDGGLGMK